MIQTILENPLWVLTVLIILGAFVYLFRGLTMLRWERMGPHLVALACILTAMILVPVTIPDIVIIIIGSIAAIYLLGILCSDGILALSTRLRASIFSRDSGIPTLPEYYSELCNALYSLAAHHIGALVIIERKDKVLDFISGGISFDAEIKSEIISALFASNSPVHDGAIIIAHGRITRVRSVLPLSTKALLPMGVGTRHRSAVGITERTDAVALVVSEQRGEVSIAYCGTLINPPSRKELETLLRKALKGKDITQKPKES